jgi:hypothetical protein
MGADQHRCSNGKARCAKNYPPLQARLSIGEFIRPSGSKNRDGGSGGGAAELILPRHESPGSWRYRQTIAVYNTVEKLFLAAVTQL